MLRAILLSAIGSALFSFLMWLAVWGREREEDADGNPTLRYVAPKFLMPIMGLIFLGVGVYEWFEPRNHRYAGNLEILSYTPIAIAILCFVMSTYFSSYRVILRARTIEIRRWPLSTVEYGLDQLQSMEAKGRQMILHFYQGRKLVIYPNLSGREYFIERLKAQ
ncbi:hypothetical protein DWU99_05325 [Dyella psychrodurans]|uniref:Uncharacterized protein n=1 Tax=Dyella psychrodurans TaxID=1927960 RepID=A0A370XEK6_9GAMM|nr:hypothetical protein DWU99_05325 [Dyella psychrodurans]